MARSTRVEDIMSINIDVESVLAEVSLDNPVGEDLEYDIEFTNVFRDAQGRAEQSMGDASIAADPANWKSVSDQSHNLLLKSKDLRLAVLLLRAQLNINGLSGLRVGLNIINGLMQNYWETVHPQLDPDDDNDPTLRVNTVITLCDRDLFLNSLFDTPLVSVKGIGEFSYKDIQNAKSAAPDQSDDASLSLITAAFMEADIVQIQASHEHLSASIESALQIDQVFTEHLGASQSPDLQPFHEALERCQRSLSEFSEQRSDVQESGAQTNVENAEGAEGIGTPTTANLSGVGVNAQINSREDAAKMMDKISEFYQKNEPSSPIPIFMERAKRLSKLSFMEIVADMAPDGLAQVKHLGGEEK